MGRKLYGQCEEEKYLLRMPGMNQFLGHPACSLIIILNELPRQIILCTHIVHACFTNIKKKKLSSSFSGLKIPPLFPTLVAEHISPTPVSTLAIIHSIMLPVL